MKNITVLTSDEATVDAYVNRRRMLLGLAAASTAAATVTVCDAVAATPAENPELFRLAAELPAIAAAYHEVNCEYCATYQDWEARTPWAPDELTVRGTGWPRDVPEQPGEAERTIFNRLLWRVGDDCPRRIVVTSGSVYWQLLRARRKKRKAKKDAALADFMVADAEVARLKKLYSTASAYEREFYDIKRQASAWHDQAWKAKDARHEALEMHVAAIMREEDFTMEGLLIKAQALAEWNRVGNGHFDRVAFRHGKDWHGQIAASILRHAARGVS